MISENSIVSDAQYCWSVSAINRAKADFRAYSKVYSVGTAAGGVRWQSTNTDTPVVRGFKIECNECGRGRGRGGGRAKVSRMRTACRTPGWAWVRAQGRCLEGAAG